MIEIEINGKALQAAMGEMVIEVADRAKIQIPRFCYHKKLTVAANCRMCLVDIEKANKPLPACATPVTNGMKVWTHSKRALQAQRSVMEFLLINHPLDCPICDQGGECELQDLAMGYGKDISRFSEGKRSVADQDIGPLITTDMTKCIHCTRCVRFGAEIAGIRELGATGRGEHMQIGTFLQRSVDSEISGNIIDLCPVGALTSKPYRYTGRSWELQQFPSVAPHDGVGSNIYIHARRGQVMRVVPRENEAINEVWLSDRDRFSYEGINSPARLTEPYIKKEGIWHKASWQEAFSFIGKKIRDISGKNKIGFLASPNSTCEELFLFKKIAKGINSNYVEHRLRQQESFALTNFLPVPNLGTTLVDLEKQKHILIIGANLHKQQPLLAYRIRKMALQGGKVTMVNPVNFEHNFAITENIVAEKGNLLGALQKASKNNKYSSIILGTLATEHPDYMVLLAAAAKLAKEHGATLGVIPEGANAVGAWLSGCVSEEDFLNHDLSGYFFLNIDPVLDCIKINKIFDKLKNADLSVALTSFRNKNLESIANVMLPISTFAETSGTFINMENTWQSFNAAIEPLYNSKPAWKVLRVLGNSLGLENFSYDNAEEILNDFKDNLPINPNVDLDKLNVEQIDLDILEPDIVWVGATTLYSNDMLARYAPSLQSTKDALKPAVYLNEELAKKHKLRVGDEVELINKEKNIIKLPCILDNKVPNNTIYIPLGLSETFNLGLPYSGVKLKKVH